MVMGVGKGEGEIRPGTLGQQRAHPKESPGRREFLKAKYTQTFKGYTP